MTDLAAHVLSRFGLGAKPGEREEIANDPETWVSEQLTATPDDQLAYDGRPSTAEIVELSISSQQLRRQATMDPSMADAAQKARSDLFAVYTGDVIARFAQSVATTTPIQERLVHFWTNHFTVSAAKNDVRPFVGAFEREAIRPYLQSSFFDMLMAVEQHPAMLTYLDNTQSIGPNSAAGLRRDAGINENLAREILELHTVSTAAEYSQADVEAFAKIITGWTVELSPFNSADLGQFKFENRFHEPGTHTVLGVNYPDTGVKQGESLLKDLALHPATANFVATKLVRHFVSDTPAPEDIDVVANVFLTTGGDLNSVHTAVLGLPGAWVPNFSKFRQPEEFLIAVGRSVGIPSQFEALVPNILNEMGQMIYGPPSPAGWPDVGGYWLSGQSVLRRADVSFVTGRQLGGMDSVALLEDLYGELLSTETHDTLAGVRSQITGLSMALASPELLYR
ncbi:MAG: DUF1800 domain-containing protein [Kordiimonadaceae bacterium]|nr:DUF1800 domain-containing protein [Kordiimonadaceae bacterium]MBO6569154.1 DUF1800 domain-containing protein [Kordiimonadaceae bacterium]MBO6964630.1 DUF1800 domain-containing protein [Kordiimonadaceae bacterium]